MWGYQAPPGPEYAGWWWRAPATIVDGIIAVLGIVLPLIPIGIVLYVTLEEETADLLIDIVSIPYTLAFLLLYFPLTMRREGAHNGQTFGKQLCGIRVVRQDGLPVDAYTAIQREILIKYLLFWTLCACALFIPTLLNFLWPLWDDRDQALHDKMANTFVLRGNAPIWVPPVPPPGYGPVQWGP